MLLLDFYYCVTRHLFAVMQTNTSYNPLYMRYSFYSLKLSPCETWLQDWIHFWRCSHRSQLAYGRWHRERRKRIKDGGRMATKENELIFSRPQATFLTTILCKANNLSEYQNFKLICSWLFLFLLRTITFHSAQEEHTFTYIHSLEYSAWVLSVP